MRRNALLLPALLACWALPGMVGCQEDSPTATAGRPDGGSHPLPDLGGDDPGVVLVLFVDPDAVQATVTTNQTLTAHVISSRGAKIANVPVHFAITTANPGRAALSAEEVDTDENGKAQVLLNVGEVPTSLQVEVTALSAAPVLVPVTVIDHPVGRLEVTVEGVCPAHMGPITLYVMPGTNRCPYNPVVVPFGDLANARVQAVGEKTTFEDSSFVAGEPVTIWGRGMVGNSQMRTMAGTGCQDGVIIPANDQAKVTLTMTCRPLNMVGTFDVVGHYDFVDAIPGTAGDVIQRLDVLFGDQNIAEFLIDGIQDLIQAFFNNVIVEVIFWAIDQIQDLFEQAINEWILSVAPDWFLDFMQVGQDLFQIVSDLELLSVIRFDKTGSDFTVAGTEEWTGIALYWRLDCDENAPPDCGRFEFDMADLLAADDPIEAVYATFNARTADFNQLRMDPHDVNLQYGRLILFVLNYLILPRLADGAHSLSEALLNAVDCEGLAWRITGDDGEWGGSYLGIDVGFTVDDATEWCEAAFGFLGDRATDILEGLSFDSVLTLEGDCDLYEDDLDLMVDRLEGGHYRGWMIVDGQRSDQSFNGTFSGTRRSRY